MHSIIITNIHNESLVHSLATNDMQRCRVSHNLPAFFHYYDTKYDYYYNVTFSITKQRYFMPPIVRYCCCIDVSSLLIAAGRIVVYETGVACHLLRRWRCGLIISIKFVG